MGQILKKILKRTGICKLTFDLIICNSKHGNYTKEAEWILKFLKT